MAAGQPSALQFILRLNDRITGPMGRVVRTVTGQARFMAAGVNRATGLMQSGFIAAMAGGLGIAAMFRTVIFPAMGFQTQMANVRAVTQATAAEMAAMSETARRLGRTTSFSASQAAEGMQFLGMAGFKTTAIIAAMPGVLDIAKAGTLELGRAADIASDILSGFGLRAAEMGRVGDVLTKTFISSNTNLEMLGESMKFVGPIASKVGVSLETVAAAAGLLGNVGIKASMAGTSLRAILLRLSAPTGAAAAHLRSLGVATRDSAGRFLGMTPILEKLAAATAGLGNAAQVGIFKEIFGERAAAASLELARQAGTGQMQAFITMLENARGTAARVAGEMDENLRGKLRMLTSAWESLNMTIGNLFLPMLSTLVESITGTVRKFEVWTARFPHLTRLLWLGAGAVLVMAVAVGVAKIAWGLLTLAMVPFRIVLLAANAAMWLMRGAMLLTRGVMLAFAGAMLISRNASWAMTAGFFLAKVGMLAWKGVMLLATGAMLLFNAALWGNPIGVVILGIVFLAAAVGFLAWLIISRWEHIKANTLKVMDDIKVGFGAAWEWITAKGEAGLARFAFAWEGVKTGMGKLWKWLQMGFSGAIDAVVGYFTSLPGRIAGIFRELVGPGTLLGDLLEKVGINVAAETPASLAGLPAPEPLSREARQALSNVANTDNSRRIQIGQVVIHPKEEVGPDFLTRTLVAEGLG